MVMDPLAPGAFTWTKDWFSKAYIWCCHCHFCVLVAQLCPSPCDPLGCSLPEFSVHGILQAKILEWVAISFSRGSSQPRDWTQVSCIAGRFFTIWVIRSINTIWYKEERTDGEDIILNLHHFIFKPHIASYSILTLC